VALDAEGKPSFGALQRRMHVAAEATVRRLARELPVTYVIFDLLWLDGHSLMDLPYEERRARLAELDLDDGERWRVPDYVAGHGAQLLAATEQQGLEGVIAKRKGSAYRSGRCASWVKVKNPDYERR
jgi:bifunctional non-homologous end joining protein LigD